MAAVLTASVGVMYLAGARAIELNKAVARQLETMSALSDVLSTLKDAETGQRGYLLTSEEEYLQPYNSARASLAQTMTRIDAFAGDGFVQPEDVPTLKRLAGEKISELERTI